MEYIEGELGKTGDPRDTELADLLAQRRSASGDFPLQKEDQELALPEPSAEIREVERILTENGFDVALIAYVDREKGEVVHAVIETVARPDYTDDTQMYYPDPDRKKDPLAHILEEGRESGQIVVPDWVKNVPLPSRFAVSWREVHGFVVKKATETVPGLAEVVERGNIVLRVPTKAEFQLAGKTYPGFVADSEEWLYDEARFGSRLVGGSRGSGGVGAVHGWPSNVHVGDIAFRLQWSSPSQKIPR